MEEKSVPNFFDMRLEGKFPSKLRKRDCNNFSFGNFGIKFFSDFYSLITNKKRKTRSMYASNFQFALYELYFKKFFQSVVVSELSKTTNQTSCQKNPIMSIFFLFVKYQRVLREVSTRIFSNIKVIIMFKLVKNFH